MNNNNNHIIKIQALVRGFLVRQQLVNNVRDEYASITKIIEGIEPRYATKNHLNRPYFSRAKLI